MPLSPTERKLRASVAGLTGWANASPADRTARGRHANRGLWNKFYDATDPALPADERAKRADTRWRAHMNDMTRRSLKARRERKEQRETLAAERKAARQAEQLDGGAA